MENESSSPTPAVPESPHEPSRQPEGPANPFARIVGVLFSPAETFESVARKPDWLVPLIIWIVIGLAGSIILTPKLDYEPMYRSLLERQSQLTEQQKEEQLDQMLDRASGGQKFGMYAAVLTVPLMFLVLGAVFWGSLRAFGADNTFKQTFSVSLYAFAPQFIKSIITTALAATKSSIDARAVNTLLKSNLGAFTSPIEEPVAFALLSSVDLFTIWTIVLFTFGLAAISRFSKTKLAIMVVAFYLVVVLVKVGFAALMGGFS